MGLTEVSVFIQARMSSSRFPGKVLAPFRGRPLLHHVISSVRTALPGSPVIVLTSCEETDDPISAYAESLRAKFALEVFRGPLDDVYARFLHCLDAFPASSFMRICADSPLQNYNVIRSLVAHSQKNTFDLVTTTFPRTFPRGQNVEIVAAESFLRLSSLVLSSKNLEHITSFFYEHPEDFRIHNFSCGLGDLSEMNLSVDEVADLQRLEALSDDDLARHSEGELRPTCLTCTPQ